MILKVYLILGEGLVLSSFTSEKSVFILLSCVDLKIYFLYLFDCGYGLKGKILY